MTCCVSCALFLEMTVEVTFVYYPAKSIDVLVVLPVLEREGNSPLLNQCIVRRLATKTPLIVVQDWTDHVSVIVPIFVLSPGTRFRWESQVIADEYILISPWRYSERNSPRSGLECLSEVCILISSLCQGLERWKRLKWLRSIRTSPSKSTLSMMASFIDSSTQRFEIDEWKWNLGGPCGGC